MNPAEFNEIMSGLTKGRCLTLFSNQLMAVFSSKAKSKTYLYLCRYGVGSSITISQTMRIGRMAVYNALNRLKELGLIELDSKVQVLSSGGRRTEIWRLKRHNSNKKTTVLTNKEE